MTHRSTWRRPLAVGLGLVGLYLVAAVLTLVLGPRPLRPLFDGFAPPPPYRWVDPPPEVAADNRQPAAARTTVPLGTGRSPFVNLTTEDGQAILLLAEGSVPPHPPDETLRLSLTPLAAGTLAPLPGELEPQSNAYRVEATYLPSGTPVTEIEGDESVIALISAGFSDFILYSPGGQAWERRPTTRLGTLHGVEARFIGPGHYLVAASPVDEGGPSGLVVVLVLVGPPVVLVAILARSRRAQAKGQGQGEG